MSATPTTERGAHPCFDKGHAATHSRIHLPVAPRCNIQCRYCDRSFDCVNESRPGVTAAILTPREALERVNLLKEKVPNLSVIGIAGPGDPLANPKETFETFRLVKAAYPELSLCLSTNGLALPDHIAEIADIGVSHLTVTVNAVRNDTARLIYSWVRHEGHALTGAEACGILWERQKAGLELAAKAGLTIKVNTILIPGINEEEVELIAAETARLGAHFMNVIPLLPVQGTPMGFVPEPSKELVAECRKRAEVHLPQLAHCKRCRADAAGILGKDIPLSEMAAPAGTATCASSCSPSSCSSCPGKASEKPAVKVTKRTMFVAVTSREGLLVNEHLGEASRVFVFKVEEDGSYDTVDIRALPTEGGGLSRWDVLAATISDCEALVVAGLGAPPRRVLETKGFAVHVVEGLVSEVLKAIAEGKDLSFMGKRLEGCGTGCSGNAQACC